MSFASLFIIFDEAHFIVLGRPDALVVIPFIPMMEMSRFDIVFSAARITFAEALFGCFLIFDAEQNTRKNIVYKLFT